MKNITKVILFVFLVISPYTSFSQIFWHFEKEEVVLEEVVEVKGMSQKDIYNKAKIWMTTKFKSSDSQILKDDEDFKTIIGTGNLLLKNRPITLGYPERNRILNFKMMISFKDEKFKYQITNIVFSKTVQYPQPRGMQNEIIVLDDIYQRQAERAKKKGKSIKKDKLQQEWDEALKELTDKLKKEVSNNLNDDW